MPSTPDGSDAVRHASPSADLGLRPPLADAETKSPAVEDVSPQLTIISEHGVILATAAATAAAPLWEGELEDEDVAFERDDAAPKSSAARKRSGWTATLARLVTPSRNQSARRPHYPARLDSESIADARMDREMYRL
jgi:hypothetical protein